MSVRKLIQTISTGSDGSIAASEEGPGRDPENRGAGFNRRNVLQGIAAGSVATAVTSGSVSGRHVAPVNHDISEEEPKELIRPYDDIEMARLAVEEHVTPVLGELAEEGYVETSTPSALGIDQLPKVCSPHSEGVRVGGILKEDDENSRLIEARIDRESHQIKFTINPDAEVVTATVSDPDGGTVYRTSNLDVSSSDCSWYCGTYYDDDCDGPESDEYVGYCSWDCACEWCGSWCSGTYTLHHILECDGCDKEVCCPGTACCEGFGGCKNLDCTFDCNCEEECNCSECC